MFDFNYIFGKYEISSMNKVLTFIPKVLTYLILVGVSLAEVFIEKSPVMLVVFLVLLLGLPLLYLLLEKLALRNSLLDLKDSLGQDVHVVFSGDSVKVRTSKGNEFDINSEHDMKDIRSVWETGKDYFLFVSRNEFYTLPKSSLKTGTPKECTLYLKEKLGSRYKRRIAL